MPARPWDSTSAKWKTWRKKAARKGGDIDIKLHPGATHDFDDPGRKRQSVGGNVAAKADAMEQAPTFFAEQLVVER